MKWAPSNTTDMKTTRRFSATTAADWLILTRKAIQPTKILEILANNNLKIFKFNLIYDYIITFT